MSLRYILKTLQTIGRDEFMLECDNVIDQVELILF